MYQILESEILQITLQKVIKDKDGGITYYVFVSLK
jgi:hypothetical protein